MKKYLCVLLLAQFSPAAFAATADAISATERIGIVQFHASCAPAVRASFDRGIALLHDFWYDEAKAEFERIAARDPGCGLAHWGAALSVFHQLWDRPDDAAVAYARAELALAQAHPAGTPRERELVDALADFFKPGEATYESRISAYATRLGRLYDRYPRDVDVAAFYALAVLAAQPEDDTSLVAPRHALAVLKPWFVTHPDHPGVVHYIIHAGDTPALASQALAAADRYGVIAPTAPHAAHMPGHIYARLGLWQADIDSNLASVEASRVAEQRNQSGALDQFHADEFLLYAYLQSGEESRAKALVDDTGPLLTHFEQMPEMAGHSMPGMLSYFRAKFPVFYALEMRDWQASRALAPVTGAPPESQTQIYWARVIGAGHLRDAARARADLAAYEALLAEIRKGRHAYVANSTGTNIERGEMLGWAAFAAGDISEALRQMRASADLQDLVGQGEVDIPAREMLADMLLELGQPGPALVEYEAALKLSPNRFNGLYGAARAAQAAGEPVRAGQDYRELMKISHDGTHSGRPEFAQAREFLAVPRDATEP